MQILTRRANYVSAAAELRIQLSRSTLPKYVERSLKTVGDVTSLLADTMNDLRSGRIDSRLANTVGFLAGGTLKAFQQSDIGDRLGANGGLAVE